MSSVSFQYVWPDADPGDYGSAEHPASALKLSKPVPDALVGANETVIPKASLTLRIDYPLEVPVDLQVVCQNPEQGFTRRELAQAVIDAYHAIYKREAETGSAPAEHLPGLQNRKTTDGEYGISAHDLEDLMLVRVVRNETEDVWEVRVDS
ncbi:hypothetical protein AURDEDRAFT_115832 [Auricularia subglabra TFB-10046 SS5]|nr:hypothetical protein AURDEDRAFT_115832 [Auricularia subglabra TFB-10046 SS5]